MVKRPIKVVARLNLRPGKVEVKLCWTRVSQCGRENGPDAAGTNRELHRVSRHKRRHGRRHTRHMS
jgi:hypothetical protein